MLTQRDWALAPRVAPLGVLEARCMFLTPAAPPCLEATAHPRTYMHGPPLTPQQMALHWAGQAVENPSYAADALALQAGLHLEKRDYHSAKQASLVWLQSCLFGVMLFVCFVSSLSLIKLPRT